MFFLIILSSPPVSSLKDEGFSMLSVQSVNTKAHSFQMDSLWFQVWVGECSGEYFSGLEHTNTTNVAVIVLHFLTSPSSVKYLKRLLVLEQFPGRCVEICFNLSSHMLAAMRAVRMGHKHGLIDIGNGLLAIVTDDNKS